MWADNDLTDVNDDMHCLHLCRCTEFGAATIDFFVSVAVFNSFWKYNLSWLDVLNEPFTCKFY